MNKVQLRHVIADYLFNEDIDDFRYLMIDAKTQEFLLVKEDKGTIKYSHKFDLNELRDHYEDRLNDAGLSSGNDFDLYHGHFWSKTIDFFLEDHYD